MLIAALRSVLDLSEESNADVALIFFQLSGELISKANFPRYFEDVKRFAIVFLKNKNVFWVETRW